MIFAGYVRRNGNTQLRFAACRGQVKRVVRLCDPGIYRFTYRSEISDGTVTVKVLDAKKRENAVLSGGDGYDFQERSLFDKRYE